MKDITGILIVLVSIAFWAYLFYSVWCKPQKYLVDLHQRKKKLKEWVPFLPDWFINYIFYCKLPGLSIWFARIITLLALLFCLLGLYVLFFGPL